MATFGLTLRTKGDYITEQWADLVLTKFGTQVSVISQRTKEGLSLEQKELEQKKIEQWAD